ncbi:Asp-tRNA(Asn)/Glu-tRNA(Gln) amidotransferase subunit GatC [candidate division KSB1 bacterium]|nr:Asp-tRNA(Asn)/Glu-tRNA(Gln) amidotransferase subunit GatC [candidate division KSB1 bacterium]
MEITRSDVENVAQLAKLKFDDDEIDQLRQQMSSIISYFEKLSELNTDDVAPLSHVLDITNRMRPDEVRESLPQDIALSNAPVSKRGYFSVPKVISND